MPSSFFFTPETNFDMPPDAEEAFECRFYVQDVAKRLYAPNATYIANYAKKAFITETLPVYMLMHKQRLTIL